MENLSRLQAASCAMVGVALINLITQAIWNNHTIKKISLALSLGGTLLGAAATVSGLFGLIVPFTYDSPNTWQEGGLARLFYNIARDGSGLCAISATAFIWFL